MLRPEGNARVADTPRLGADDIHYFNEGRGLRTYERMGAHPLGKKGVEFSLWAPNAHSVSVIGDFNGWNVEADRLFPVENSGIWAGKVKAAKPGQAYKFAIHSRDGQILEKADPYAVCTEVPPRSASVIASLDHPWQDGEWMANRHARNNLHAPMAIYEVHLGSWRRGADNRVLSYRDLAGELVPYVQEMGFTHVELMPVMEHPFDGSWGYQLTGYFAPSSRFGSPQDFMYLIECLHKAGIGVILDWVPSHFAVDGHGLAGFDGTSLYEHASREQGFHPDWGSFIFNYGRREVRSFLISNALFWMDKYHIDGLRVDAVASMLYLDYSRKEGEWVPNEQGGRENLEAISFLRELNTAVYGAYPDVQVIAEESTAWPGVSHPVETGGLGFGLKWDMGWMHDTLDYFSRDPIHRSHHQNQLTFRSIYGHHENFILPLSHDEVVHGKNSLIGRMPGDDWQKFANLRALYTYMYAVPGKKMLFMGSELAQWREWTHNYSLDWHLLEAEPHRNMQAAVRDLNRLYTSEKALQSDFNPDRFGWTDTSDHANSVLSFLRTSEDEKELALCVFNLTPVPRENYVIGVPRAGTWQEIFNSDALYYGGSGMGNMGAVAASPVPMHGQAQSLALTLPPLSGLILRWNTN